MIVIRVSLSQTTNTYYLTSLLFTSIFEGFVYLYYRNIEELPVDDLMVEFTGFILDIILFGFIISFYDYFSRKREKISNLELELNQIRFLTTEQSRHRQLAIVNELLEKKKEPFFEYLRLPDTHITLPDKNIIFYSCVFATDEEQTMHDFNVKNFNSKDKIILFYSCGLEKTRFYNLTGKVFIWGGTFKGKINKCNVANFVMHDVIILDKEDFKNQIEKIHLNYNSVLLK